MPSNNYINRIRGYGPGLIRLLSLDESSGGTTIYDYSPKADNASVNAQETAYHRYDQAPDGRRGMRFTRAATHSVNLYSAAFQSNINTSKGSILMLCRQVTSYWNDSSTTHAYLWLNGDAGNRIIIYKGNSGSPANGVYFRHAGNGTLITDGITSHGSPAEYFWLAMTWDIAGSGTLTAYLRNVGGAVIKDSTTGVTAWAAVSLGSTTCCIGNTTLGSTSNRLDGGVALYAHYAGVVLTDNDVVNLTKV